MNKDQNTAVQHIKVAVEEFNDTIANEKSNDAKLLAIGTKFGMKWVADLLKKGEIDTLPVVASRAYKRTRNKVIDRETVKMQAEELPAFDLGFELATHAAVEAINNSFLNAETKTTVMRLVLSQLNALNADKEGAVL
jgi:hypothetical protein